MNRTRNAIIVLALLGAVAVVNYFVAPQTDSAETQDNSEQQVAEVEPPMEPPEDEHTITQPELEPFGSDDAVVKLEVFYEEDNDCQSGISSHACDLAQRYQPYVQTQLRPWNAEGTQERADELDAHCLVVVAVSEREGGAQWGPAKVEFIAPPDTDGWSWGDLEGLVATRLAKMGVDITPAELLARSATASDEPTDANEGAATETE